MAGAESAWPQIESVDGVVVVVPYPMGNGLRSRNGLRRRDEAQSVRAPSVLAECTERDDAIYGRSCPGDAARAAALRVCGGAEQIERESAGSFASSLLLLFVVVGW